MDKDEKHIRLLEILQQRAKILSDSGIKGIIVHLGVTAFSMNAAFKDSTISLSIVQIVNIVFTSLALFAVILGGKDFERLRKETVALQKELYMGFDEKDFSGFQWMHRLYAFGCVILIVFWITLSWVPWKP